MVQPTPELPADTLVSAVDNAGRGVVTHITIKGDRVAAIVSQSTLEMSRLLAVLLTSEIAASALPAVLPRRSPGLVPSRMITCSRSRANCARRSSLSRPSG
jgi:hypothetical protein